MDSPRRLNLTVTTEQTGWKVDELLRGPLALSGTVIRRVKWLEDGILLDGVRAMVGDRVRAGQVLSVVVGDTEVSDAIVPGPGRAGAQQGPRRGRPPRPRPLFRYNW